MKIEILNTYIFPKEKIISGVTKKNLKLFPNTGLSFSNAETLTDEQVLEHQKCFADYLEVPISKMKFLKQIHSDIINPVNIDTGLLESDGIMTNEKGLVLNVKIADCVAVLIYDPKNEVIAGIHSGWKGSSQNIAGNAIQKMKETFLSKPENLLAFISPAASGDRYEVGYEVAQLFKRTTQQVSKHKYLFDNKREVYWQLLDAGLRRKNIEVSSICTIGNTEYHSYRRDKAVSGRMSAFIMMR